MNQIVTVILALAALCFFSCGGSPKKTDNALEIEDINKAVEDACEKVSKKVDDIWNENVFEQLNLTVKVYQGDLDALAAGEIIGQMAVFSDTWNTLYENACLNKSQPGENSNQLVQCLIDALAVLDAKIIHFEEGDLTALSTIADEITGCESLFSTYSE